MAVKGYRANSYRNNKKGGQVQSSVTVRPAGKIQSANLAGDRDALEDALSTFVSGLTNGELDTSSGDMADRGDGVEWTALMILGGDPDGNGEDDINVGISFTLEPTDDGRFEFFGYVESQDIALFDMMPLLSQNPSAQVVDNPQDIMEYLGAANANLDRFVDIVLEGDDVSQKLNQTGLGSQKRQALLAKFKASGHELLSYRKSVKFAKLTSAVMLYSDEDEIAPSAEIPADAELIVVIDQDGEVHISQDGENFIEVTPEEGDFDDEEEIPEDSIVGSDFTAPDQRNFAGGVSNATLSASRQVRSMKGEWGKGKPAIGPFEVRDRRGRVIDRAGTANEALENMKPGDKVYFVGEDASEEPQELSKDELIMYEEGEDSDAFSSRRLNSARDPEINKIRDEFHAGKIGVDTAQDRLMQLDLPPAEVTRLMENWRSNDRRKSGFKGAPKQNISHAFKAFSAKFIRQSTEPDVHSFLQDWIDMSIADGMATIGVIANMDADDVIEHFVGWEDRFTEEEIAEAWPVVQAAAIDLYGEGGDFGDASSSRSGGRVQSGNSNVRSNGMALPKNGTAGRRTASGKQGARVAQRPVRSTNEFSNAASDGGVHDDPPGQDSEWGINGGSSRLDNGGGDVPGVATEDGVPVTDVNRDEEPDSILTPSEISDEGQHMDEPTPGNNSFGVAPEIGTNVPSVDEIVESGEDVDAAIMEITRMTEDGDTSANVMTFSGKGAVTHASSVFSATAPARLLQNAGIDVHSTDKVLLRGNAWKKVRSLLRNWKRVGAAANIKMNKTYVFPNEGRAFIVRSSRFVVSMVKASVIPGTQGSKFTTFVKMGKSYLSNDGFVFSSDKLKVRGYPKYVAIAQSNKAFFEKKGIRAGDYLGTVLSELDREYFTRVVNGYKAKMKAQSLVIQSLKDQGRKRQQAFSVQIQKVQGEKVRLSSQVLALQKQVNEQKRINSSIIRQREGQRRVQITESADDRLIQERADLLTGIMNG